MKQERVHHQLHLCVTLIVTIIVIILRLLYQEHNAKHFPYIILANSYDNHGKPVLLVLYTRWENSLKLTNLTNNNRMNKKADQALQKPEGKFLKYLLPKGK